MHAEFHSIIIEYLSENAERKIISQYYMNSKDFKMRPEIFYFYYRTESNMLEIYNSQAAAQISFST